MNIPGYDAWRLQSPPEYDDPETEECPDCDGTGHYLEDEHGPALVCETCGGSGEVPREVNEPDGDYLYEQQRDRRSDNI